MRIQAPTLTAFVSSIFQALSVPGDEARDVAQSLVASDLSGHESHGVMRVAEYAQLVREGNLRPGAALNVRSETPAALCADAGLGFGQVQCRRLIERVVPKAQALGVACGTMTNSGHVGRLAEWVERLADGGLAGLISVNDNGVLTCVAPPGGFSPRISTNPVAIGVPSADGPMVLDISTSVVANGKVRVAHLAGRPCPPGWLQDALGNPTTDPAVRFADPPGTLLPLGGAQGYKGFGLGLFLDFLVGGLSGGYCPPAPQQAAPTNNVLLLAWDGARFAGAEHLKHEIEKLTRFVRQTPTRDGRPIRLPGDHSRELRAQRLAEGIPVDDGTWRLLADLARSLRVAVPAN
ncbi:MAG: Ldh family oxidoreductase [Planctomycetia bacterium]|nr:Ldh family oxidoreductase [Planctomycetia bacterium]